jgi:hypothetical protein
VSDPTVKPTDDPADQPPGQPSTGPGDQPPLPTAADPAARLRTALVAELATKSAVSWIRHGGRSHAVWHVWSEGALCLVSGGDEQPLPDVPDGEHVEVVMRSRDTGGRLLTWVARTSVVHPDDEQWEPTTTALVTARLNLDDPAGTPARWATSSVVRRLVPDGEFVESPGDLSVADHRAVPEATPATTRGPLPRVLHKRVERRPRLD